MEMVMQAHSGAVQQSETAVIFQKEGNKLFLDGLKSTKNGIVWPQKTKTGYKNGI
jgi:hypothetical protein